ncbi:shikimate kinase AroK [Blochmannia endosymbiont of Polyrhachis (Hedomyrma) turneri]|uniref:shikimate kinase AroK n=1 Tax=Blochmannia endosymbiont of Polyrhachis (Hedomyrma) turneri TaxID=1505596 RepID=UPI00061A6DB7|nr:shikimate kinase AroK [Blochmannia endosymbiont of Polyrhachis (Hedomyrma) turneri]AKC60130.1 shikimate kinase 1 [Blochmannia endosymbiont of Polyrhachis (Hedomyrma) turneri]
MVEKRNIFLVGPMGAGKSTVGRQLAQKLHMDFFDSDTEIENRTGADISWVFDVEGEEKFREREEKVISELASKHGIILATGGGSIQSLKTRNCLSARGFVIYLKTSVTKQFFRTKYDKKRPLLQVVDDSQNVLEKLANERNPLYKEISDFVICTDEQNAKMIVNKIIHMLNFCG